jgi:hypothetical protein
MLPTDCEAYEALRDLHCDLPADHMGPHIHFGYEGTTAWDLNRRRDEEGKEKE